MGDPPWPPLGRGKLLRSKEGRPQRDALTSMNILWVKAGKLLPVDTGGKIRSYNIVRRLASRNEVTLLSYYNGARDEAYEKEIVEHLPGALAINTGITDSNRFATGLNYLRRLPNAAPFAVTKFTSPKVKSKVGELLSSNRLDVCVCDFLAASLNFPIVLETPTVLFQHNVESSLWRRQALHEPNIANRVVYKLEAAKMLRYEREAVDRFDHVIAVSDSDRQLMCAMTDPSRIDVVPTGVDLQQYRSACAELLESKPAEPLLVFVGSMDWEANIDAVDYFCREVYPAIKQSVPRARLRIVGRNPHARVKKLANDSIEVTGTVASVVEHYRDASVNIVPLRIGGGTRLKIYEAMAMGKATVSTSIGAEGLDVNDGRDILIADSPEEFAESTIALLTDEQLRKEIETGAAEQAARYDWSVITERFEEVLAGVARCYVDHKSVVSTHVGAALRGRPSSINEGLPHQGGAATEGRPHTV
jgi:glycosyltransferase involved in cell wall biosynthesis